MTRFLLLSLVLGQPGMVPYAETVACPASVCTATAPTGAAEGVSLVGMKGYRVTVEAASGQTLAGTGDLLAYVRNPTSGLWAPDPGLTLAVDATGRTQAWPDLRVAAQFGRVRYVASGVGVSGGSLTVRIDGWTL